MNLEQIKEFYAKLQIEEAFHGQNSFQNIILFVNTFGDDKTKKATNKVKEALKTVKEIAQKARNDDLDIITNEFITTREKREKRKQLAKECKVIFKKNINELEKAVNELKNNITDLLATFTELIENTKQQYLDNSIRTPLWTIDPSAISITLEEIISDIYQPEPPLEKRDRIYYESTGHGHHYKMALLEDAEKMGLTQASIESGYYAHQKGFFTYGEKYIKAMAELAEDYIERKELEEIAILKAEADPEYKSIKEIIKEKYGVKLW